jgi:hypothetical protein
MNNAFEFITTLQYRLKAAHNELQAFRSGKKYIQMQEDAEQRVNELETIIKKLKAELEASNISIVRTRNQWFDVFTDLQKEQEKERRKYEGIIDQLEKRALKAERERDEALYKAGELRRQYYDVATELEEEKGKNLRLTAQLNHDYENSSIPSSMGMKKKKVKNSRETTGRKPGGQPGHKGHGRKKQVPTQSPILLPPPQEVIDNPDFKKTSKTIVKQVVGIRLMLEVAEYHADVYYNSKTGERIHAQFPEGVVDDVNYDGSVKAFLFLLNNDCNVSIDKSSRFLNELTQGKLSISKGMINKLSREFADKSKAELDGVFRKILGAPVMHTDFTNAREKGKNAQVLVCATPGGEVIYFAKEKKGHEGIKDTPVEDYLGILVHDHDTTFYKYGSDHQECLAHILRYLLDSVENEPGRTWSSEMRTLIREMIHYRNGLAPEEDFDSAVVEGYEKRYSEILEKARREYEDIPASDYYRDGYNLYIRMEKYMQNHLLFLHDKRVPTTNNEAERLLRNYKRKQRQAVTFRSFDSIDYLCQCMSMLVMMRKKEENVFDRVSEIFG